MGQSAFRARDARGTGRNRRSHTGFLGLSTGFNGGRPFSAVPIGFWAPSWPNRLSMPSKNCLQPVRQTVWHLKTLFGLLPQSRSWECRGALGTQAKAARTWPHLSLLHQQRGLALWPDCCFLARRILALSSRGTLAGRRGMLPGYPLLGLAMDKGIHVFEEFLQLEAGEAVVGQCSESGNVLRWGRGGGEEAERRLRCFFPIILSAGDHRPPPCLSSREHQGPAGFYSRAPGDVMRGRLYHWSCLLSGCRHCPIGWGRPWGACARSIATSTPGPRARVVSSGRGKLRALEALASLQQHVTRSRETALLK